MYEIGDTVGIKKNYRGDTVTNFFITFNQAEDDNEVVASPEVFLTIEKNLPKHFLIHLDIEYIFRKKCLLTEKIDKKAIIRLVDLYNSLIFGR